MLCGEGVPANVTQVLERLGVAGAGAYETKA